MLSAQSIRLDILLQDRRMLRREDREYAEIGLPRQYHGMDELRTVSDLLWCRFGRRPARQVLRDLAS